MIEFTKLSDFKIDEPTVITIGKFDGEHKGHKKIFEKMKAVAKDKGLKTAIFSFDISPSNLIEGLEQSRLTTNEERINRIKAENIDYFIEYPFTKELAEMNGESFVREILIKKMNMKAIVAGPDVAFGYKKSGNKELLDALSKELDFEVHIINKEKAAAELDISSTLIRALILEGHIKKANELLGSLYSVSGEVRAGNRIGNKLFGIPTLNIFPPEHKILPKHGVYATRVKILSTDEIFDSITNVGNNPTVKDDLKNHAERIETHIFDFDRDIYKEQIEVCFIEFIREETKFPNLCELKTQMEKDMLVAREILNVYKHSERLFKE